MSANAGFQASRDQTGGGVSSAGDRDRSEFAKFCKFFTIRVVQVVVQSRTGRKIRSQSRVIGQPTDWFNVSIEEVADVNEELKHALDGQYLSASSPTRTICLLISLRTVDGDTLHLEIWQLSLNAELCDPGISVRSHLYHRMSVLMRSVIAASRVTPTYKLYARRQGPESFVLRYQISSSPVQLHVLGDGAKTVDLGYVASPFGALKLAVHYRTKMVISDSAVQLSGTLRENYYDAASKAAALSTSPKRSAAFYAEPRVQDASPWAPLPEPSAYKALPPLPDFSPCFSTFSTSPLSSDFPLTPSPVRRPSGVAFQLGATSCSSSEEGSSGNQAQAAGGGEGARPTAGPLVLRSGNVDEAIPKRNSSGTLFKMELSGAGGSVSPKPSSFPDNQAAGGYTLGPGRGSLTTIHRDTFPFAQLLPSNSAPSFGGPPGHQYHLHYGSLTAGISVVAAPASSTAICKYSPKRRAVTTVAKEKPGSVRESDENLESSREVMVTDGVKIVEKRRTRKGRKKGRDKKSVSTASAVDGAEDDEGASSESESSCDDSFVRYEIRPVFASGSDLGAFFNQCKSAPTDLISFAVAVAQPPMPAVASAVVACADATAAAKTAFGCGSLEEIPERLKLFEEKQKIFDDFVKSLKVDSSSEEEHDDAAEGKKAADAGGQMDD